MYLCNIVNQNQNLFELQTMSFVKIHSNLFTNEMVRFILGVYKYRLNNFRLVKTTYTGWRVF